MKFKRSDAVIDAREKWKRTFVYWQSLVLSNYPWINRSRLVTGNEHRKWLAQLVLRSFVNPLRRTNRSRDPDVYSKIREYFSSITLVCTCSSNRATSSPVEIRFGDSKHSSFTWVREIRVDDHVSLARSAPISVIVVTSS